MGFRWFDLGDSFQKGFGFITLEGDNVDRPRSLFAVFWHVEERRLLVKAQAAEPLYFGNSIPEDSEELLVQDEQGNLKKFRASDMEGSRIVEILQCEQWPVSEMAE